MSEQKRIFLSPPHMSGEEMALIEEAFDSNYIAPLGPQVDAFEREMCTYLDVSHAVALSSGTAALHLALLMSGVGAGDEVLCSTLTFSASANAICYTGARPVFIDSRLDSWNLDPELVEDALLEAHRNGKRIKALMAVDLYGQCADYQRLEKICTDYQVTLIEDAAEALGASYGEKKAGTFGKMAALSFNGNKIITTSGGGMLLTQDEKLAARARFLSTQARDPTPHYQHSVIGYNYRMSNVLAAIGRGQLRVIDERVRKKRSIFENYTRLLGDLEGLTFMPEMVYGQSNRWLTCICIDPIALGASREEIRLLLEQHNIESRPVWKPMHLQPVFSDCRFLGGSVSEKIFREGLCLPSGTAMDDDDMTRICSLIRASRG
jgi:pyridoxal phosphate-dependent aminotransferase EpsN